MPRLRLNLPKVFAFRTELTLRVSEMNYGGHLGNDSLLGLIHEARLRWLATFGQSETSFYGLGLIMIDLQVMYKRQGFRGEKVSIEVAAEMDEPRFSIAYRVCQAESGDEIARVQTGMACFDYKAQKVQPTPDAFADYLRELAN